MKKLILVAASLLIISGSVIAQPIKFLEERTAFCYSEKSLSKYLQFASKRNLDGSLIIARRSAVSGRTIESARTPR